MNINVPNGNPNATTHGESKSPHVALASPLDGHAIWSVTPRSIVNPNPLIETPQTIVSIPVSDHEPWSPSIVDDAWRNSQKEEIVESSMKETTNSSTETNHDEQIDGDELNMNSSVEADEAMVENIQDILIKEEPKNNEIEIENEKNSEVEKQGESEKQDFHVIESGNSEIQKQDAAIIESEKQDSLVMESENQTSNIESVKSPVLKQSLDSDEKQQVNELETDVDLGEKEQVNEQESDLEEKQQVETVLQDETILPVDNGIVIVKDVDHDDESALHEPQYSQDHEIRDADAFVQNYTDMTVKPSLPEPIYFERYDDDSLERIILDCRYDRFRWTLDKLHEQGTERLQQLVAAFEHHIEELSTATLHQLGVLDDAQHQNELLHARIAQVLQQVQFSQETVTKKKSRWFSRSETP